MIAENILDGADSSDSDGIFGTGGPVQSTTGGNLTSTMQKDHDQASIKATQGVDVDDNVHQHMKKASQNSSLADADADSEQLFGTYEDGETR